MVTTVYLVRHAEAMGNVEEFFQGHTDCDLSPKGEKQIEFLKERFKDISFDAIYSSPLIRTRKTADAVNFYHGLPITIEPLLIEIFGGDFEGMSWKKIPELYPKEHEQWSKFQHLFKAPNGEAMDEVYERMVEIVNRLVSENEGKTIVLVSHGCAIKNFLCYANGIPISEMNTLPWSDNTAVSKLLFSDGKIEIDFQNDASHLPAELSTLAHQSWWRQEVKA